MGKERIKWVSLVAACALWVGLNGAEQEEVVDLEAVEVRAEAYDVQVSGEAGARWRQEFGAEKGRGAGTLTTYLERLGWLGMNSYSGGLVSAEASLRGFGENSGLRVKVVLDGQPMNPADMGGIDWTGMQLGEIGTVEIRRGGRSVEFGGEALSGVILLESRGPEEGWSGQVGWRSGSDGYRQGDLSASYGWKEGGWRISAGSLASDGYRENNRVRTKYLSGHLELGQGRLGEWSGRVGYSNAEQDFPGPLTFEEYLGNPRQGGGRGVDRMENRNINGSVRVRGELGDTRWEWVSGVQQRERQSDLGGRVSDTLTETANALPKVTLEALGMEWTAGMELRLQATEFIWWMDAQREVELAEADVERELYGGFMTVTRKFRELWTVEVGVRVERVGTAYNYAEYVFDQLLPVIENNRGTYPNPDYKDPPDLDEAKSFVADLDESGLAAGVSLTRQIMPGLQLWGGIDRIYRYPSTDEAAAYQGYSLTVPVNTELRPETGLQYETGLKWAGERLQLSATAFLMHLEDEILFDDELNTNADPTRRLGAELDAHLRLGKLEANAYLHYVDARFSEGKWNDRKVPLVAPLVAGVNLRWRPQQAWLLEAGYRWTDQRYQGNDFSNELRTIPDYGIAHLSAQFAFKPGWLVNVSVENLLDQSYLSSAVSGGFYPGNGRQLFAGIEASF